MKFTAENISSDTVDLFNDESTIVDPGGVIIVYDSEDATTVLNGYKTIRLATDHIVSLMDEKKITISEDENETSLTSAEFKTKSIVAANKLFRRTTVPYDNVHGETMFYSLVENKLYVLNRMTNKWYSTQLTEVVG